MKYKRKKYGLLIIVTLLLVSVGYALINTTLKLNGSSKIKQARWNIYFDKVEHESGVTSTETKIDDKKTTVSFDIDLEKPGDYYQFNVDTVNDGTIDAIIDSTELTGLTNTTKEIIDYDVTYSDGSSVNKCDTLHSGDRKTLLVKVKYFDDVKEEELLENNENLKLKFKINYVQDGTCDRNPVLEIDPNGGKYNNSRKVTKRNVEKNSSLTIPEAEREGYDFVNWKTSAGVDLEKDSETHLTTINVGTSDIKVIAQWKKKIDPSLVKHTITIDPNGGLYNGSEEVITYQKKKNETVEVNGTIEREGYIFKGWNVVPAESSFVGNVLTVGLTDVTLTATWELDQEKVVAKIGNKYYTTLQKAFNAAVTGDKIELLKDIEEVSTNTKEVSLDLGNHTINGTINNSGILTVDNGKIQNLTVGQAPIVNTGTIIIGTNDERVIQDSIILYGKTTGLVQNGQFYFYDGYIEGNVAFKGGYNGCAENYIVYVDHDNVLNCQKAYLTLTSPDAVVKVKSYGGDGPQLYIYFRSLGDGIRTTTNDNPDVYALKSFPDSENITVAEDQILNINLEGFTISEGAQIINNGTLTIKDTVEKHGTFKTETYAIINNGTLNLSNVNVVQTMNNVNTLENHGNMNFTNSTIQSTNKYALYNKTTGTLTFTNDTYFKSNSGYSFYNDSTEEITIVGGNFAGIYNNGRHLIINGSNITSSGGDYSIYNEVYSNGMNRELTLKNVTATASNKAIIYSRCILNLENTTITQNGGRDTKAIYSGSLMNIMNSTISGGQDTINAYGTINIRGDDTVISNTYNGGWTLDLENTTNVNMYAGLISSSSGSAIYHDRGTFNLYDGRIITYSTNQAITPDTLNMSGGEIISTGGTAIYMGDYDHSTTVITGGLVKGKTYGIYAGSDTLTIGIKDDVIDPNLPDRKPIIMGDTYGIYKSSATVKFYDGIIKGKNDGVYYGTINDVPDGSLVVKDSEEIEGETYYTAYLNELEDFFQVGQKTFNSLNKAVKEITDNYNGTGTIKTIKEAYVYTAPSIPSGKNITLDLNGFKINSTATISNSGTLTIVDNSTDDGTGKKGEIYNANSTMFSNSGTLKIDEGIFNASGLIISNTGTTRITGGNFTSNSNYCYSAESGSLNITGGNFLAKNAWAAVYIGYTSSNTIKNGTFSSPNGNAFRIYYASVTMDNITINNSNVGISYRSSSSNVTVTNSNITAKNQGVYNEGGNTTLTNCTVHGNTTGVYSYYGATTTLNDTTVTGGNNGAEVPQWGTLVVNGGSITAPNGIGINADNSTVNVVKGTITGKTKGINTSSEMATIIIGNNSDQTIADKTDPVIIGDQYGIYKGGNSTTINFYDGIIKSKDTQINSQVTRMPDQYITVESVDEDDPSYKTTYLEKQVDFIQVGDNTYNSLQNAINAAGTNGTMTLIGNGLVAANSTIANTQNITLDLNGYAITTTMTITNNGTFTIKDDNLDHDGEIVDNKNLNNPLISNNGTLIINNGNLSAKNSVITSSTSSNITINGGTLTNLGTSSTTLYSGGNLTVNGGVIDNGTSGAYAIYSANNTSDKSIKINGGTIGNINSTTYTIRVNYGYDLEINDGANIVSGDEAIKIDDSQTKATLHINGGTIHSKNTTLHISSNDVTIVGGTIISDNEHGIESYGGQFNITGGEIRAKQYGIYLSSGVLTLGENDTEIKMIPSIKGELYGLYKNGGTVNFNDGILKGKTAGYTGIIQNVQDNTLIASGTETDSETSELYQTNYLTPQVDFVQNKTTLANYNNLQTAITEATSGDELELTRNGRIYEPVTIPDKTIKLDLNNYNIITTKAITNNGTLTIIDENTSGTRGTIETLNTINLITNNKNLTINNVVIKNNTTDYYVIKNKNASTLTLIDAEISSIYGIDNFGASTLNMNNSNITTSNISINSSEGGTIDITGGTIYSTYDGSSGRAINSLNTSSAPGNITIRNATTRNPYYPIYLNGYDNLKLYNTTLNGTLVVSSTSSLEYTGGVVNGSIYTEGKTKIDNITINSSYKYGISNHADASKANIITNSVINTSKANDEGDDGIANYGYIEIRNTDINFSNQLKSNLAALNNYESGYFKFIGGSIVSNSNSYYDSIGVINNSTSTDTSILSPNSISIYNSTNDGVGIYSKKGILNLKTGTINVYNNSNSYGIYQTGGEVILGTYDGSELYSADVSTIDPYIKAIGTTSGIGATRTSGTFRFFDGRLEGSTSANPQPPTQIEPNYIVKTYTSVTTGNEYSILECLSGKGASDIVDWNVKITDDDIVKSRTFSVDDVPWVDGNNNPVAQLQYGAIGNITIRIDGTSMSSDFKYKINVTMADGSPIEVTNNNHEEIMDISEETIKSFTVVLTCSSPTADYTQVDKNIPILITIEKVEN